MSSIGDVFRNLDWSMLLRLLLQAVPALLCIMVHEISHGLAAYALGDHTAKDQGRLSLNPLRHIDWIGLVMLLFAVGYVPNQEQTEAAKHGINFMVNMLPAILALVSCLPLIWYISRMPGASLYRISFGLPSASLVQFLVGLAFLIFARSEREHRRAPGSELR